MIHLNAIVPSCWCSDGTEYRKVLIMFGRDESCDVMYEFLRLPYGPHCKGPGECTVKELAQWATVVAPTLKEVMERAEALRLVPSTKQTL